MSEATFDLAYYRARVAALADRGVFLGTSSWKYEGWLGQIYTPERYEYRGKVAKTRLEEYCLKEYAETFRTVCVDAAFYQFFEEPALRKMAEQVPDNFRFGFKTTEEITVKHFSNVGRLAALAGQENPNFLNAQMFIDRFLGPMEAIRNKVGPIILEFGKFHSNEYEHASQFIADLDRFFEKLPKGWIYSVELRNRKWLGPEYLACLKKHGVAHVFNNWTDMPSVKEQIGLVQDQVVEDVTVARFLLKPGRKYEDAVQRFRPYKFTGEINDEARAALAQLIERGWVKLSKDGSFIYINNRLEGNALLTVEGVLDRLEQMLQVPRPAPAPKPPPKPSQSLFDLGM
jgi:uncharacterized protein YecE (DUF72 family)